MSRRLLLGRAGAGKTHACLDLLTRCLREEGHPLLLVPTYSQAEHLRTLLLDRAGGLAARCVETFSSLAERVLRRPLRDLATPAERDRVAETVLRPIFGEAAGQPGFRAEFLASVKEGKDQGIEPARALDQAKAHFPEGGRGHRFFLAYARYAEAFTGTDHEDLLLRSRDRLRTEGPELDLLLLDGFHDFTPVQKEIVDLLASRAKRTVLTLPCDPRDEDDAVFATAARTARAFADYERTALEGNRRAGGSLRDLEQRLFRGPAAPVPAPEIECWACASEEDEADRLARHVRRSGRPYADFLLLRRSFDGAHEIYRAAFRRHGVPLRFFGAEPLGGSPAARAAMLFLEALQGPLPEHDLLALQRSPFLLDRPPPGDVDALAAELRETGTIAQKWSAPAQGRLSHLLARHLGVRDALLACPDGDEEIARAARLFSLLGAEAEALDDLDLREGAERLRRRVPLLRGSAPDRRHDCVYAVEAMDARQWEKPVVLVAGLSAENFPRQVREDLFLRDDERRALAEERDLVLPLRSLKEDEERYLFYVVLTRARERLVLTYPAFDEEGTARPPSPYLEEALAHFHELKVRRIPLAQQYVLADDAVSREDLLPLVADGLSRVDRREAGLAAALYDRRAVEPALLAWPRRLALLRARPLPRLPEDPAAALSASSLNSFLRCPYLFLMRRVLRVEPPRERALDPLLRGTIVHDALERCAREKETSPLDLFDEVFAEETRGLRLGLDEEAQRRWMRAAVARAAEELRKLPVERVEQKFSVPFGDLVLTGRIDRTDRTPKGELVRDYKTGRPDLKAAENHEDIQLDLYLLALPDAAGAVFERLRQGDAAGFALEGVIEGKDIRVLTPEQMDDRRQKTAAIVRAVAEAARRGALAVAPRDPESCTRTQCDGYDLCRVPRARWLGKRAREERE